MEHVGGWVSRTDLEGPVHSPSQRILLMLWYKENRPCGTETPEQRAVSERASCPLKAKRLHACSCTTRQHARTLFMGISLVASLSICCCFSRMWAVLVRSACTCFDAFSLSVDISSICAPSHQSYSVAYTSWCAGRRRTQSDTRSWRMPTVRAGL